jgi:hypothetical protein
LRELRLGKPAATLIGLPIQHRPRKHHFASVHP